MTTESTNRRDEDQRVHVEHTSDTTGIFDAHHPPTDERISDCVHCGFCLPTCPTYTLWGEEMDSPRGRIYLMKLGKEGAVPLDDTYVQHFDACLGCMACVTACPSGVRYDELIEAVRPQLERNYRRSLADRLLRGMIFQLFPYPTRLRAAAVGGALYQRAGGRYLLERSGLRKLLPAQLRAVEELMPPARLRGLTRRLPAFTPAQGTPAAARRHAGGMRPAGFLPRRQRGDGACAGPGGLRRDCAARAAVLRRAQRARRPGNGGAGAGPSTDRRFRTR